MQIASDLHLEFHPHPIRDWQQFLTPAAPYLALVGDICELKNRNLWRDFMTALSPHWKHIFVVNGNHEYYAYKPKFHVDMLKARQLEDAKRIGNVTILDNEAVELEQFTVVGTTLWTHVPMKAREQVETQMNDYRALYVKEGDSTHSISVDHTNQWHEEAVRFLHREITIRSAEDLIVLTHHAPLTRGTSAPEYEIHNRGVNHGYATDLSSLFKPNVKAWVFGHTHYCCAFKYRSTLVVSNALGYGNCWGLGAIVDTGYKKDCVIAKESLWNTNV